MRKILVTAFAALALLLSVAPAHASKLPGGPDDSASPSVSVSAEPSTSVSPSASVSASASASPSATPSVSASATVTPRPSRTPSASPSPEAVAPSLPVTGTPVGVIVGFGIMAVGAGLGLTLIGRRRKVG
jgi:hypothetical protein